MPQTWRRRLIGGLLLFLLAVFISPLWLVHNAVPVPADVIIVIGGDHKPERLARAAELYHQGYAPLILLSAGNLVQEGSDYLPEAEVMRRQALALGLPAASLRLETQSLSTYQNAYYTRALCEQRGFTSVLLVTSAYQSRRAAYVFQQVFPATLTVSVLPASAHFCALCGWAQPDQASVIFYEYYNWLRYGLGVRLANEAEPK